MVSVILVDIVVIFNVVQIAICIIIIVAINTVVSIMIVVIVVIFNVVQIVICIIIIVIIVNTVTECE